MISGSSSKLPDFVVSRESSKGRKACQAEAMRPQTDGFQGKDDRLGKRRAVTLERGGGPDQCIPILRIYAG
jgi:hypothetical protein